jgi:hypothetical protein
MSEELVVLRTFGYRHEAELAQGFLRAAGIQTVFQSDDGGGSYAGMSFSRPIRLLVRAGDAEEALQVLDEAGYGEADDDAELDDAELDDGELDDEHDPGPGD